MSLSSKVFHDAVHDSIEIHPLCVKIIDTPQFQRLRWIKQLGIGGYSVFPCAAHNRFEHCIGVCHLAGEFVRALRYHQPELEITETDILCVEIAGLCHDLGHGPFSHLWETFMHRIRPEAKWKHEKASITVLDHLIKENNLEEEFEKYGLTPTDLIFIKEIIKEPESESVWPYLGRPPKKGFLYQIVANHETGIDVDKWDYFLRDGHSLGLQVTFNYMRLMKFSRVINISGLETPNMKLCFRDKEAMNLYDMFHTRMMLHKRAYQHRVVKVLDTMIMDVLILANDHITYPGKNGENLRLCDVVDDPEAMTYLNDDVFHRILRSSSPAEEMKEAKRIINNIFTRHYYPCVGHTVPTTDVPTSEQLLETMRELLPHCSKLKKEDLDVQFEIVNYGAGNKNPILKVGFYTKEEPNVCRLHRPKDVSKLLPSEWEERVIRVVCRKFDLDLLDDAKLAFSKTCEKLGIPRPSWNSDPDVLTPMKSKCNGTSPRDALPPRKVQFL